MKKVLTAICAILMASSAIADDVNIKVAVFDPVLNDTSLGAGVQHSLREIIVSSVVKVDHCTVIDYSLIEAAIRDIGKAGAVAISDSEAMTIARRLGADKIVLSMTNPIATKKSVKESIKGIFSKPECQLTIKIVDIEGSSVDSQKMSVVTANNCYEVASSVTEELLREIVGKKQANNARYGKNGEKFKVAIFDPTTNSKSADAEIGSAVREIISSTIVNTGFYDIVERSLLEAVMSEQHFSNSGLVDDNDATEIGKLAGADKIIVSVLTSPDGRYLLTAKLIDVKTGLVERQKYEMVPTGQLLDVVEKLTLTLIGAEYGKDSAGQNSEAAASQVPSMSRGEAEYRSSNRGATTPATGAKTAGAQSADANELVLYLPPQQIDVGNSVHKNNYIEVYLNGKVVGGGTVGSGFDIRILENKPSKYKLEIYPTSTSIKGATNTKMGMTTYEIDTRQGLRYEFLLQIYRDKIWTVYSVLMK